MVFRAVCHWAFIRHSAIVIRHSTSASTRSVKLHVCAHKRVTTRGRNWPKAPQPLEISFFHFPRLPRKKVTRSCAGLLPKSRCFSLPWVGDGAKGEAAASKEERDDDGQGQAA